MDLATRLHDLLTDHGPLPISAAAGLLETGSGTLTRLADRDPRFLCIAGRLDLAARALHGRTFLARTDGTGTVPLMPDLAILAAAGIDAVAAPDGASCVAVRLEDGTVTVTPAEPVPPDDLAVSRVRAVIDDYIELCEQVLDAGADPFAILTAAHADLLDGPDLSAPLSDVVEASGYAIHGDLVCFPDADPSGSREVERLVHAIGQDIERLRTAIASGPPDELVACLRHPRVSILLWDVAASDPDACDAAAATVPRDQAGLLRAAAAYARKDLDTAETLLDELHRRGACPGVGAAHLAELAAERGDVRRAAAVLATIGDDHPLREVISGLHTRPRDAVGRNDACPCGSGRKYKRCCGAVVTVPLHERFDLLACKLGTYARHSREMSAIADLLGTESFLALDALLFTDIPDGREPLLDRYLRERGHRLPDDERELLARWRDSVLQVAEVTGPKELRPVPGDATVRVRTPLPPGRTVIGRILPDGDDRQIVWCVPVPAVRRAELALALRDGHVALAAALRALDDAPSGTRTTDGQRLVFCTRVYAAGPDVRAALDASFRADGDAGTWHLYTTRDMVAATVTIADGRVRIETMSEERLAAVEFLLDGHLRELIDEDIREPEMPSAPTLTAAPPAEAVEALHGYIHQREREWIDEPVPALGGLTPCQARDDPDGRIALDELLRHFDDARPDPGTFDTGRLRELLGITR